MGDEPVHGLQFLALAGNTPISITNRDGAAVARAVVGRDRDGGCQGKQSSSSLETALRLKRQRTGAAQDLTEFAAATAVSKRFGLR